LYNEHFLLNMHSKPKMHASNYSRNSCCWCVYNNLWDILSLIFLYFISAHCSNGDLL